MIKYNKFFELMNEKNVSTYELRKRSILGSTTIKMLRKNQCGLSKDDLNNIRFCQIFIIKKRRK